jgi:hypothetical protein
VLKRILIALIPVIATRIMNKRSAGQPPRADKRRFPRNGR